MTDATTPSDEPDTVLAPLDVDLAVIGSGAAGLSAALTAAKHGLKVAVFEKAAQLGGTSAWCSGWMWIPGSGVPSPVPDLFRQGDDPADARTYLRAELGAATYECQQRKVDAFLETGPRMLSFYEKEFPSMRFELDAVTPDFHATPGHHFGGRMVRALAFDARRIKDILALLRRPLPEFTFYGLAIEAGSDLDSFLYCWRSFRALAHVLRRVLGYIVDLIEYGRDMWLVNGNALVARLLASAVELEEEARRSDAHAELGRRGSTSAVCVNDIFFQHFGLFTEHAALRLIKKNGVVCGLMVRQADGQVRKVVASKGVILACGGFPHDMRRIRQLFPKSLTYCGHRSAAPDANAGDGLRLGEAIGAKVGPTRGAPAAFTPVSVRRRPDGSNAVYPHFVERSKPGVIAVRTDGRRFCDEAIAYHDFVLRWLEVTPAGKRLDAWLVCDFSFVLRYGIGMVKPLNPFALPGPVRDGYLKAGLTIEALARRCGIDHVGLRDQVRQYNAGAPASDPEFARGNSAYDRSQGDPHYRPNPCVSKLWLPPFFAVRLQPGSLGTLAGLHTDEHTRVLDAADVPIPGLYACGNDMSAVMGGSYPSNGVTLASAMIFGHVAGLGAAAATTGEQA